MTKLPAPPPEPPACHDVGVLAPAFKAKLGRVIMRLDAKGWQPIVRETYRSNERAAWLFGFGRTWDDAGDPRGIVTEAPTALKTWHHYNLAADVGDRRYAGGNEPAQFWRDVEEAAAAEQLTSGGNWHFKDRPHLQWWCEGMHVSPSDHAGELLASAGVEAVWRELHAEEVG